MATTTTNFGWDIPQSTDLVKDGATAIAALGQDIDTALVDLKGGTTGQVLAKASGTDLDFSWVAQDDSNAIQNAIVDAKGDLISATGADTPARLAVGTNNQVLTADSSTATGLKWATPAGSGFTYLTGNSFSAVSSVSLPTDTFTSTYKNYAIVITLTGSTSTPGTRFNFRMRASGTDNTSSNYRWARLYYYNAANGVAGSESDTTFTLLDASDPARGEVIINLFAPQLTERTQFTSAGYLDQGGTLIIGGNASGLTTVTTSYDAMTFYPANGTITGRYEVYGYANS